MLAGRGRRRREAEERHNKWVAWYKALPIEEKERVDAELKVEDRKIQIIITIVAVLLVGFTLWSFARDVPDPVSPTSHKPASPHAHLAP
jgi:hypothetical protein